MPIQQLHIPFILQLFLFYIFKVKNWDNKMVRNSTNMTQQMIHAVYIHIL